MSGGRDNDFKEHQINNLQVDHFSQASLSLGARNLDAYEDEEDKEDSIT